MTSFHLLKQSRPLFDEKFYLSQRGSFLIEATLECTETLWIRTFPPLGLEESMSPGCRASDEIWKRRLLAVSNSVWLYPQMVRCLGFMEQGGCFMYTRKQL